MFDIYLVLAEDWGMVFVYHAFAAFLIYLGGLRPFLHHMGSVCLLYELSTPLMHLRRHLIEVAPERQDLIAAANYAFGAVFVVARLVVGLSASAFWWVRMFGLWAAGEQHSSVLFALYLLSNLFLNGLNVYWFSVMVALATGRKSAKEAEAEDATPAARKATKEKE
jgi:hypothetical protein